MVSNCRQFSLFRSMDLRHEKTNEHRVKQKISEATIVYFSPNYNPNDVTNARKEIANQSRNVVIQTYFTSDSQTSLPNIKLTLQEIINEGTNTAKVFRYLYPHMRKPQLSKINTQPTKLARSNSIDLFRVKKERERKKETHIKDSLGKMKNHELHNFIVDKINSAKGTLKRLDEIGNQLPKIVSTRISSKFQIMSTKGTDTGTLSTKSNKILSFRNRRSVNSLCRLPYKFNNAVLLKCDSNDTHLMNSQLNIDTARERNSVVQDERNAVSYSRKLLKGIKAHKKTLDMIKDYKLDKKLSKPTSVLIEEAQELLSKKVDFKRLYDITEREVTSHLKQPKSMVRPPFLPSKHAIAMVLNK
jgi:hypothetical protein